jgi:hypothetical protein
MKASLYALITPAAGTSAYAARPPLIERAALFGEVQIGEVATRVKQITVDPKTVVLADNPPHP